MNPRNFFTELKRRNVYKVAVAYAVVAWLLIQAASIVLPTFEAPGWTMKILLVALATGFPIVVVLAWAFEITPEGIVRAEDVRPNESITRKTGRKLIGLTVVLAAVAAALLAYHLWRPGETRSVASTTPKSTDATERVPPMKSIAVLPFENLSEDKNAAYFADGIQDEILTKLASVGDLKVISRTSTAKYKSKPEDLKTVSQQLGVATILEGTVQKAADKVRVNVQLIDARADSHLWARTYDRDIQDVFAVESEVAQEIADALQAKLSPAEMKTVASAPTKDPAAYDFFLKAESEQRTANATPTVERFDEAAASYREAIARDPDFAVAMAELAVCRMRRHWLTEALTDAEVAEAGELAKKALALAPNLAETHVALGVFHYYGFREYEAALGEFRRALELQPNNSEALQFIGFVHRRRSEYELTLTELGKAQVQDPRNANLAANISQTYCFLREWKEAEESARHALAIDPHDATAIGILLVCSLNRDGNAREGLRLLADFPTDDLLVATLGTVTNVVGRRAGTYILNRDFDGALQLWEKPPNKPTEWQRLSAEALIHVIAGDSRRAHAEAEPACPLLEARLRDHPTEVRSMRALSWVYLALDRGEDALRMARHAVELLPPEKDGGSGVANLAAQAEIEAHAGATSEAVKDLRRLLAIPAGEIVSIARLKIDPVWDPIRNDAGFKELLAGQELVGPGK